MAGQLQWISLRWLASGRGIIAVSLLSQRLLLRELSMRLSDQALCRNAQCKPILQAALFHSAERPRSRPPDRACRRDKRRVSFALPHGFGELGGESVTSRSSTALHPHFGYTHSAM